VSCEEEEALEVEVDAAAEHVLLWGRGTSRFLARAGMEELRISEPHTASLSSTAHQPPSEALR
jgi:hypothetical protein